MTGTLINVVAILIGASLGLIIHSRLPRALIDLIFQGIGLITMVIGISMAVASAHLILAVVSIVLGAVIGQTLHLDRQLDRLAQFFKKRTRSKNDRFSEGLVTASMLFCIGSMAILGPIEESAGNPPNLLLTKSLMDGIASVALATSFGVGILFSAVPVLIYQGSIALLASVMMQFMSDAMITELTAVGGILLIGLGINILKIKEINVTNLLPSLLVIVVLGYFFI